MQRSSERRSGTRVCQLGDDHAVFASGHLRPARRHRAAGPRARSRVGRKREHRPGLHVAGEGDALLGTLRMRWKLPECLEVLAAIRVARGQAEFGVRLFGAAEVVREATGNALSDADRPVYQRGVEAARAALGEDAFAAAWA